MGWWACDLTISSIFRLIMFQTIPIKTQNILAKILLAKRCVLERFELHSTGNNPSADCGLLSSYKKNFARLSFKSIRTIEAGLWSDFFRSQTNPLDFTIKWVVSYFYHPFQYIQMFGRFCRPCNEDTNCSPGQWRRCLN